MPDTQKVKSNRDRLTERLRSKYPDREYADDEALYGQVNDDYDQSDKEIQGYRDRETRLNDVFRKNPRATQWVADMANGRDPFTSMIERHGIDNIREILDDPEKAEQFAQANQKYLEKVAKSQENEREYAENVKASIETLQQFQQENGLDEDQANEVVSVIDRILDEAIRGIYSKESLELAMKAVNHDSNVANARDEGRISGLNSKIEAQRRQPKKGDGLPQLSSGAGEQPGAKGKSQDIFSLAAQA